LEVENYSIKYVCRKPKNSRSMAFYFTKFPSSRRIEEAGFVLGYVFGGWLFSRYKSGPFREKLAILENEMIFHFRSEGL
jgi:hypothetical protein